MKANNKIPKKNIQQKNGTNPNATNLTNIYERDFPSKLTIKMTKMVSENNKIGQKKNARKNNNNNSK